MANELRKILWKQHPSLQPQVICPGVTITKKVKDLYDKSFKTLKKEIKEGIKRWKNL